MKTEQRFCDLLAIDSCHAMRDGAAVPGSDRPQRPARTFLASSEGHGSTVSARMREQADISTLVLWQTGAAGWAPSH